MVAKVDPFTKFIFFTLIYIKWLIRLPLTGRARKRMDIGDCCDSGTLHQYRLNNSYQFNFVGRKTIQMPIKKYRPIARNCFDEGEEDIRSPEFLTRYGTVLRLKINEKKNRIETIFNQFNSNFYFARRV